MMKSRKRIATAALASMLALTIAAPAAFAEETQCRGTIGAVTVDNLLVPQGASCTLEGTKVEGTIKVENGATLNANGVRVKGNVQSEGFQNVSLTSGSTVGGSVQLKNGLPGGTGSISSTTVTGDLQFETNKASMSANGNTLLANFQVVGNTGGVQLSNNTIAQNLQCKENVPAPTGANNKAGDAEDQCETLVGSPTSPPGPTPTPNPTPPPPVTDDDDDDAPAISAFRPTAGGTTGDRTPALSARISDDDDLAKGDIKLYVDGKRIWAFAYNRATDRMAYTSKPLSVGRHAVKIVANDDDGDDTTKLWRFRVVR